jgi:membrane-associated phospholipid phosphatase
VAIFGIADYYTAGYSKALAWTFISILLLIGPASLYVLFGYLTGHVTDINLSERDERLRPLALALTGAVIGTIFLFKKEAPTPIILVGVTLICELTVVILITLFWKISLHSLTLSSVITLFLLFFTGYAAFLYLLLIPVAWARIWRKRHTLNQTLMGAAAGAIIAFAVFALFEL